MWAEVIAVTKLGRNQTCPCGSRRKVKHCCGTQRGPSPDDLAWQCLYEQARKYAPILGGHSELEIDQLLEAVIELPVHHLGLQIHLPRIAPPELESFRSHIYHHDEDMVDAVQHAAAAIDTPQTRLALTTQATELFRDDQLDLDELAIIMVDLARPTSLFLCASLITATAVRLGRCPTPSGLLLAAS